MTDAIYFQFLRLPADQRAEPLYTGVSHNSRRAYLINYNTERGEFIYAERRALLGFSEECPPWRTLDIKKAATLDGLLELIDPKLVEIMGVPCQRLAA